MRLSGQVSSIYFFQEKFLQHKNTKQAKTKRGINVKSYCFLETIT